MIARIIVLVAVLVALAPLAFAQDDRCRQLRELDAQYRGVSRSTFSEAMRNFERRARAWYARNCR